MDSSRNGRWIIHLRNSAWSGYIYVIYVDFISAVACPKLFAPVYGHMQGERTGYGDVVTFHCDKKYKNIGSSKRQCQSDRTWSGTAAKCEGYNV